MAFTRVFTVAIDGPAAAGKGTIARAVARHFGFGHLDTGLLYRAVGVQALQDGRGVIDPHWAAELARRHYGGPPFRRQSRGPSTKRPPRSSPRWNARKPSGKKPGLKKQKVSPSVLALCRYRGRYFVYLY